MRALPSNTKISRQRCRTLADEWHQNLIESAAEASEELMEKYLVVKN